MICKICKKESKKTFEGTVLGKYPAEYFLCEHCGFLQVGNPGWLHEAYVNPINVSDVGYVSRNVYLSKKTLVLFTALFGTKKKFLDYAAGYGMLVRLMRDYGLDFYWDDPYTRNLFAQGFVYDGQKIAAMTCFECFEHFEDPIGEIEKMLKVSDSIFFSTLLLPGQIPPPPGEWGYYGLDHGQHIAFYSIKTLRFIAETYGLHLYSDGANLHLLTKNNIAPLYFRMLLLLSKFQADLVLRKLLKSKIEEDYRVMTAFKNKK